MNFIKAYKFPLGITLALISVFFIFQNATCGGASSTGTSGVSGASTAATGASNSTLALTSFSTSVGINKAVAVTASGGTAPYSFFVVTGGGSLTFVGPTSQLYQSPATTGTAEVAVSDSAGATAYVIISVVNSTTSLSISAAVGGIAINGTDQFTASGGVPPYSYYVQSGGGSITTSGFYTAPSNNVTATVEVVDSVSQVATASITVGSTTGTTTLTGTPPTAALNAPSFNVVIDQFLSITYSNPTGSQYPTLTIFGSSPSYTAGTNCSPLVSSTPCLQTITLNNFYDASPLQWSYRGIISSTGRGGTTNLEYCIASSDITKAYINWVSGNNGLAVLSKQFLASSNSLSLFSGAAALTAFVPMDSKYSGAASYNTSVTGQYSVHPDCSDVGSSAMQVQPW